MFLAVPITKAITLISIGIVIGVAGTLVTQKVAKNIPGKIHLPNVSEQEEKKAA
jgi:hypothetical protein